MKRRILGMLLLVFTLSCISPLFKPKQVLSLDAHIICENTASLLVSCFDMGISRQCSLIPKIVADVVWQYKKSGHYSYFTDKYMMLVEEVCMLYCQFGTEVYYFPYSTRKDIRKRLYIETYTNCMREIKK